MMPENNTVLVYKGTLDRLALVDQLLFGGGGRPLAESLAMGRSLMLVVFWAQKEPVVLSNHTATHSPADLKTVHVPAKLLRLFCNHFASASATPLSIFSPAMLRQYTDFALGALLNSLRQRLEDAKPLQGLDRICAIAFGIYSLTGGGVPVPHLLEPSAHLMKGQGETFFLEFLEASIDTKSGQAREAGKPSLAINCPPAKTSHQDQAAGGAGFGQQTQAAQTLTSPRPPAMVKNAPTPQAKVTGPVAHPSPPPAPASTTPLAPASAPAPRTATEERTKESGVLTLTEDFILPSSSSNPAALLPPGTAHANSALKAAKQPPKPRLEGTRGAPGALSTSLALTRLSWQAGSSHTSSPAARVKPPWTDAERKAADNPAFREAVARRVAEIFKPCESLLGQTSQYSQCSLCRHMPGPNSVQLDGNMATMSAHLALLCPGLESSELPGDRVLLLLLRKLCDARFCSAARHFQLVADAKATSLEGLPDKVRQEKDDAVRPLGSNPQGKSTSIRTPESPGKQAKSDDGADTSAIQQRVSEQVTDGDADPTRGKGRLGSAADVHPSPDVPSPCGAAAEREVLVSSDLGLPPDVEDILAACKAAAQLQASAALPSTGRAQTAVAAAAQPAVLNGKGKGKEVEKSPQISQGSFCSDEEGPMSDDLASSDDDGVSPDALGPTQTSMRKPSKAKSSKESPPSRSSQAPGKELIGKRVRAFWETEGEWFEGKIVRYIKSRKVHVIEYDDGDMEEVGLPDKTIQVVDD